MKIERIPFLFLVMIFLAASAAAGVPSPEEFLGFPVGADRKLADYEEVRAYFDTLAARSPWVRAEVIGRTTLGKPFVMAVISTPENLAGLDRYTEISRRLADPRGLSADEARRLAGEGKTFVMITCNLHSDEIASSQMALELAYDIAAGRNEALRGALEETVLFLVPSLNPDGLQMVVDWYEKWVGTEYEGCRMPWLYHHYAGHDNNRDWFMCNLAETRAVFDLYFRTVVPHVILDMHQMWSTGARLFLPQFYPPANVNVDPILYREVGLLGYFMQLACEERGHAGVISDAYFTAYWEGTSMMTPWWHNQVGLLSEAASVHVASPIYIEDIELQGGAKGFPRYEHRINFPNPWPGGWWRLRDIVDYELAIAEGLMDCCARHSERLLMNFYRMGARAVERGGSEPPYAFVVPRPQRDQGTAEDMIEALMRGGVEVHVATKDFMDGDRIYRAGSYVIRLDQPYGPYAKDLLEVQEYPDIRASKKEDFVRPYDVTGWTLPLQMGVTCEEIEEPLDAELQLFDSSLRAVPSYPPGEREPWGFHLDPAVNNAYAAIFRLIEEGFTVYRTDEPVDRAGARPLSAGTFFVPLQKGLTGTVDAFPLELRTALHRLREEPRAKLRRLESVKTALFKPYHASMDEGWTRLLFDTYRVPYENVGNEEVRKGKIDGFDVLLIPDISPSIIREGKPSGEWARFARPFPPEYAGGIDEEGVENIKKFVAGGGTLICFDSSCDFAIEALELPVSNTLEKASRDDFFCPGSILEVSFRKDHPVAYGMPDEGHIVFTNGPAFATTVPYGKFDRAVLASYESTDPLASGLLIGPELLYRRAALVEMRCDGGRVILFGFRPQHRCQSAGTYKLVFNALLEGGRR